MTVQHPKAGVIRRVSNHADALDDFPTPPWAVRALFHYVAPELKALVKCVALDPAAGRGHIVQTVAEFGLQCAGSDIYDYGAGFDRADYLDPDQVYLAHDVVITNPPYRHVDAFAARALAEARIGVALLVRTMWLEGSKRYALFSQTPPTRVAVFSRRMPAAHGRLVRQASAMMSHSWFIFCKRRPSAQTALMWIPPTAQKELEQDEDYEGETR